MRGPRPGASASSAICWGRVRSCRSTGYPSTFGSVANRFAGGQHAQDALMRLGLGDQVTEHLALQREQVFLAHHRASIHIAATDHLGDHGADLEVVGTYEAAVA